MLRELLRPFSYLHIQHTSRTPQLINWVIPVALSLIAAAFVYFLRINLYGESGLISKLLGFFQSLPGFYIAALAAIATFNNPDMLKVMPGDPPTIRIMYNNSWSEVPLTRRRFLSSMFAYLTAVSIGLTLISVTALSFAQPIKDVVPAEVLSTLRVVAWFAYSVIVAQMILVTFWGIFYLGERVHTPD